MANSSYDGLEVTQGENARLRQRQAEDHRHVTRTIPLGLILSLVVQTAAMAWIARGILAETEINAGAIAATSRELDSYRAQTTRQVGVMQGDIRDLRENVREQSVQLGRIDQNIIAMREGIERLAEDMGTLADDTRRNARDINRTRTEGDTE